MNEDFNAIECILSELQEEYISSWKQDKINDPQAPITERDIVSEIYCRLKKFCHGKELSVHTEIKPVSDEKTREELKIIPRIDVVILRSNKWIDPAMIIQNIYTKGDFEARYSSIPVEFIHTAIEVKIQSNPSDAKKDLNKLNIYICEKTNNCNIFFVLLNAKGSWSDHDKIKKIEKNSGIRLFEYTSKFK